MLEGGEEDAESVYVCVRVHVRVGWEKNMHKKAANVPHFQHDNI